MARKPRRIVSEVIHPDSNSSPFTEPNAFKNRSKGGTVTMDVKHSKLVSRKWDLQARYQFRLWKQWECVLHDYGHLPIIVILAQQNYRIVADELKGYYELHQT